MCRNEESEEIHEERIAIFESIQGVSNRARHLSGIVQNPNCVDENTLAEWRNQSEAIKKDLDNVYCKLVKFNKTVNGSEKPEEELKISWENQ